MKIKNISGMFMGSCIIYVAMAACSGTDRYQSTSSTTATTGVGGNGGVGGSAGTAGANGTGGVGGMGDPDDGGGIFDAFTDPVPDAMADPTSGSRLKAKFMKAADGARAPIPNIWFDSQRNEDCSFRQAADGTQRCMPNSYAFLLYYSDAACTAPIVYTSAGCTPPPYLQATEATASCSGGGARIYSTMAKIQPMMLYIKSGTTCTASSAPITIDYYSVGAEIPLSAFVEGSVEIAP